MFIRCYLLRGPIMATPRVSFEFFPPKTPAGLQGLMQVADRLRAFDPEFASVTYGAGGSTQETTANAVGRYARRSV